ncbi:MAG: PhoH family protein [Deltaproteobacteria bacterium]|jgi:phosphate starvation-inducible PhoH-like protein|nr:PhoH family protein [Deltaproteobacteria bacterium]
MPEIKLEFEDNNLARLLYGDLNKNLTTIEEAVGVSVKARGNELTLKGLKHEVELAERALQQLFELLKAGYPIYPSDVAYGLRILERSSKANLKEIFLDSVYITANKRVVSPKSINQKKYIDSIRQNDIVFGIGPAGTGKTYLAVAMAISALISSQVKNIILTRPAVEAGESLGFLPGDMAQKVDPYLRPLYDALNDMLGREKVLEYVERGIVEIAPLAFMRGRTLNSAFVILDEAQNTSHEQMKMFLTRLGFDSKAVITGDITQIDLPRGKQSGLVEAAHILKRIKGIGFSTFSDIDVVRHPLVQQIIRAYAKKEGSRKSKSTQQRSRKK